jgi:ketosteroid isomerase-like protein
MMNHRSRRIVEAFFAAYGSPDPIGVAALVSEDVEWQVTGPVEVMSFCGHWRGKMAVMRMLRESVPGVFAERTMVNEELLFDGDRAAAIAKLTGIQRNTRRVISYRLAHFLRLEDDKIVTIRTLVDSLNAAEQLLGHPIDLSREGERALLETEGNRVAV